MRKGKILKGAVVLLFAVALFLSTIVTAETVKETYESQTDSSFIKTTNPNPVVNPVQPTLGPTLFLQSPSPATGAWYAYTSDLNSQYRSYDNFWDITEPICDIHWWGVVGYWTGTEWIPCNCDDMVFEIVFYTDIAGEPGAPTCVYTNVIPICTFYDNYDAWTGYEWSYDLDPCCQLNMGWVSIVGVSHPNDCWFLWMNSPDGDLRCLQEGGLPEWKDDDLAFELTAEEEPIPAICCDPMEMDWSNVKPGATVEGSFHVWNCGDPGSMLNWTVDSWPQWMTDGGVVFVPTSGSEVHGGPGTQVDFTFTAPNIQNQVYSGRIKVINTDDPSDYCDMTTSLETPRNKAINTPFLNWLQSNPNMFPMLQLLLQLLGLQ
jgi:hypothetical protein